MEIQTTAIQSYQKNQNLAGLVPQNSDIQEISTSNKTPIETPDDLVSLSTRRDIFDWVAQAFPQANAKAEGISRISQTLFEYHVLNLNDLKTINALVLAQPDQEILPTIEQQLGDSQSFSEQQQLRHLKQVFATLDAAERMSAA